MHILRDLDGSVKNVVIRIYTNIFFTWQGLNQTREIDQNSSTNIH